jgi:cobalt-zinc-cadmium efflux system outer membrane protein
MLSQTFPSSRARQASILSAAALLVCIHAGCQRYTAQPLNITERVEEYLARTPASITSPPDAATNVGSEPAVPVLTLAHAQAIALVYNPQLRLARARADVTLAAADNAGFWDDPALELDIGRVLDTAQSPWKLAGALAITLPISGRLSAAKALTSAEHHAQLETIAQQEWQVRIQTRRNWDSLGAASALKSEIISYLAAVDSVLELVTTMESAGEISRAQRGLFAIERATQQLALANVTIQIKTAELELKQTLGLPPSSTITFSSPDLWPTQPQPDITQSNITQLTQLTPQHLALTSPALRVAAAHYQAAERALALEIREQYPDLTLAPGAGRDQGEDELTLGISLPLPTLNRNREAIARATAQRELAATTVQTTLEATVMDHSRASTRLAAATAQLTLIQDTILPTVQSQVEDIRAVAALGEVSTFVLLESLKRRHEAMIMLINTRLLALTAATDLTETAGPQAHPQATPQTPAHAPTSDMNSQG